jgi:hypothetical protein
MVYFTTMRDKTLPPDLKPLVLELKKVKRFVNGHYPENVFQDDVYQHTLRCVSLADDVADLFAEPDFPIDKSLLQRILWIHDMVEIGMSADVPAPDKQVDPVLEQTVEVDELNKAKTLLSSADFYLWEQFELAKKILSGEAYRHEVILEAVLARIIDVLDGNIFFNRSLTRWLYHQSTPCCIPEYSLTYCFSTNRQYADVVAAHPHWHTLSPLLEAERDFIKEIWRPVSLTLIPPSLHPHLAN